MHYLAVDSLMRGSGVQPSSRLVASRGTGLIGDSEYSVAFIALQAADVSDD